MMQSQMEILASSYELQIRKPTQVVTKLMRIQKKKKIEWRDDNKEIKKTVKPFLNKEKRNRKEDNKKI